MQKLIINAAITGCVHKKEDNINLPCNPKQIIEQAVSCAKAGAAIVHIHARDENGDPSYKKQSYREIIAGIREHCPDLIICGSATGRYVSEFEKRAELLFLPEQYRPDLTSLTLGSMNFPKRASINQPQIIQALAKTMAENNIKPELEIFDFGMVDYAKYLIRKNFLKPPFYCNIFLGSLGTLNATPYNLASIVRSLPENTTWSATGIGRFQFYIASLAVTMGGHVRTGLEDNLFYDIEKTQPATNLGLIERIKKLADAIDRPIATPEEARNIIGLPQQNFAREPSIKIQHTDERKNKTQQNQDPTRI